MANISILIIILFILTTVLAVWLFYRATGESKAVAISIVIWMSIQASVSFTPFYHNPFAMPPRFFFLIGPGIAVTILLFVTKTGRAFIDRLDNKRLTMLHVIRVPVEVTLYYLFLGDLIPILMTFEGRNFDIISGITAPVIYYLVYVKKIMGTKALLSWNVVCLALLANIMTIAIRSAKTPFQQLAFDHPNVGVLYFPFIWLPSVVVPLVLFSHLASIRQLLKRKIQ